MSKAQETSPRPLTAKQQRFVEEYLFDLNATQAAIRAGYSKKTAEQIGHQQLKKTSVAAAIGKASAKRTKRTEIDADWLLRRLAEEVEADMADLYHTDGSLLPVQAWPMVFRKGLVAGVDTETAYEEVDGKKRANGLVHKVRLSDRLKRLELIGKHVAVGAFAERHEHTGKNGGPIETADVSDNEVLRRIVFALKRGLQLKAA